MELGLLIFGIAMACVAAIVVVGCVVSEMSEAWDIKHYGWQRGHRMHHQPHRVH